jgi:hypothetical protein
MIDSNEFTRNVSKHTLEELAPYVEQHVAWSIDGKQLLAHAQELPDLYKEIDRLGLKEYVVDFISDPNLSLLGGLSD